MSSFKMAFHAVDGRRIVEVWNGDEFIASIYPVARGLKVVSKHPIVNVALDDSEQPNTMQINIGEPER